MPCFKTVPNLSAIGVITISVFSHDNDVEHVLCVVLGPGIIFIKFELGQTICACLIAPIMIISYFTP